MSDMNEKQQSNPNEETPKTSREETRTSTQTSTWKKLLAKRWVFPATYMLAAAIILSLLWVYQGGNDQPPASDVNPGLGVTGGLTDLETQEPGTDTTPVNASVERMQWPVKDPDAVTVLMPYFDETASQEERAAALLQYGNEITPHMGISIGTGDDAVFDVTAALSGKVTRVEQHPLVGNLVEITHDNGLVTVYQSLNNVQVSVNDEVKQGQVIAQAGRNELERDLGVHVHFEVRENGQPLNPEHYLPALESGLPETDTAEGAADGAVSDEPALSDEPAAAEDEAMEEDAALNEADEADEDRSSANSESGENTASDDSEAEDSSSAADETDDEAAGDAADEEAGDEESQE